MRKCVLQYSMLSTKQCERLQKLDEHCQNKQVYPLKIEVMIPNLFVQENAENVSMQQGIIIDLLKDDSYGIRSEACRRTLFILSTYFDTFPLDFIKQCLTQVIFNI